MICASRSAEASDSSLRPATAVMRAEHGRFTTRTQCKAFVDDDGCDIGIEHRRTEGILEASDDDRLIDERVNRTPQPPPFGCEVLPVGGGNAGHDQGLEIGPARLAGGRTRAATGPGRRRCRLRLHSSRRRADGTSGSLAPAQSGSTAPTMSRHRRRRHSPSGPPSVAGRDSRETPRSSARSLSRASYLARSPVPPAQAFAASTRSRH